MLRYWETEFPALSPSKSRSGQRVYSEKELGVIRRIKELLYGEGYTIAGAKKRLEAELLSGALDEAEEQEVSDADSPEAPDPELPLRPSPRGARARPAPVALEPEEEPQGAEVFTPSLDTQGTQRIRTLRSGIRQALAEAREILAFLESSSP